MRNRRTVELLVYALRVTTELDDQQPPPASGRAGDRPIEIDVTDAEQADYHHAG